MLFRSQSFDITATENGNYSGKKTCSYVVVARDLSQYGKLTLSKETMSYTGAAQAPTPTVTLEKDGMKTLTVDNGNLVTPVYSPAAHQDAGTVTVVIKGKTANNITVTGSVQATYEITKLDLSKVGKLTKINAQTYTGKELTPELTVNASGIANALTKDTD